MKKIMCALLAVSLLLSAATACGGGNKSTSVPSVSSNSVSSQSNADEESSREESSEEESSREESSEEEDSEDESSQEENSQEESSEEESSQDDTSAVFTAVSTAPANKGLDSPEDVMNAYLEAILQHDPEALYALFFVDELTFINTYMGSDECYGDYWRIHDQETLMVLIDSAMYDVNLEIQNYESSNGVTAVKDISVNEYFDEDEADEISEEYEYLADTVPECQLNFTPATYCVYNAIFTFGAGEEYWVGGLGPYQQGAVAICIDGRWYLSGLMLDALSGDGF